ncbi:hypothetical protein NH398_08655 [Halomonas sp. CnH100-B]|uniref:Uncharacterized protein n=1 Tax=Vreelandella aquamarina TaxID=77097 RepID=A0A857GTV3_9GAMM|nr:MULTISPECIES: hypothetical protein [Halomonas]MCO7229286.1 hypothetical protein [Halomonas sp. CnH100-B]QHD50631.1 hypothetical protein CTT34_13525 [Halomonas meridiana]
MAQGSTNAALSPWNVVALDTFHTPERTQASQWRRSWRAATTWMIGREASERQAKQESELRALPEVKLAHWAPSIDWTPAAHRLEQALRAYEETPVVLFISPPHGGHEAVVSHWAAQQGIECLTAPTLSELVDGRLAWVDHATPLKRWAIPALERHFLRHTNGLQGVRELVERALSGRLGMSVIGCDSWTYAYLQHAVGLEGVPVLTLQGLEGEQLAHYFSHRVTQTAGACPTVYSTRTGKPILSSESDSKAVFKELQRLAAHCRGHLGIAWHYWRERLREPSEANTSDDAPETRSNAQELWLLDALADAELPADTGDLATLLLHTLLIHGGLEDQALKHVLPFSDHEALNARFALARRGILSRQQGRWQVAPLSYASVRQLLESRNYLVDPL